MLIIQKFLTNQIAANEIIILMTPYCPTPQHLLYMQERLNLPILKTFLNQLSWNTKCSLRRITVT